MAWKKFGVVLKAVVDLVPLPSTNQAKAKEQPEEMGVGEQRKSSSANNPPPTPDSCASQSADAPKTIEEAAEEQLKSRQENPNNEGVSLSLKAKSESVPFTESRFCIRRFIAIAFDFQCREAPGLRCDPCEGGRGGGRDGGRSYSHSYVPLPVLSRQSEPLLRAVPGEGTL